MLPLSAGSGHLVRYDCVRGVGGLSAPACVHVAGHNLGILMRRLTGPEPNREAAAHSLVFLLFVYSEDAAAIILVARPETALPSW